MIQLHQIINLLSDVEEIVSRDEHEFGLSVSVHTASGRAEAWDPHRFILTGFDGATECDLISVFIGSCSRTTTHCWEPLDEGRVVVSFRQDIGGFQRERESSSCWLAAVSASLGFGLTSGSGRLLFSLLAICPSLPCL